MTWPERADRWLDDHPWIKAFIDGLAILLLGWLFYIFIRGLI